MPPVPQFMGEIKKFHSQRMIMLIILYQFMLQQKSQMS